MEFPLMLKKREWKFPSDRSFFPLKDAFVLFIGIGAAVASHLQELALSLALKCLSFDFVGTTIDESSEEFGTVQVGQHT